MIEQITVNPINEKLFSAEFLKGFRCGAKRQYQADVEEIAKAKFGRPTADRPKNMIHIDEVYRLVAGHSDYHGDSILSAFTCLVEGKDVKPIAPLDESADRPTDEEDQLKFYYVESIDDYWIGMRIDNFYYADWHDGLGFVWSKSRYLPWGEHVVDENTLWKEHTYPSEPIEIPFTKWIVGFVKKYFTDRSTGWIPVSDGLPENNGCMLVTIDDAIEFGKYEDGEWSIWVCEH